MKVGRPSKRSKAAKKAWESKKNGIVSTGTSVLPFLDEANITPVTLGEIIGLHEKLGEKLQQFKEQLI